MNLFTGHSNYQMSCQFKTCSNTDTFHAVNVWAVFSCNKGNFIWYDVTVAIAPYSLAHFSMLNQSSGNVKAIFRYILLIGKVSIQFSVFCFFLYSLKVQLTQIWLSSHLHSFTHIRFKRVSSANLSLIIFCTVVLKHNETRSYFVNSQADLLKSFSSFLLFKSKVTRVVNIKLGFMDWFFCYLLIPIK